MKSYNPEVRVTLIKSKNRSEVAPGLPVSRDRYGRPGYDITKLLGDRGSVRVTKSVREPAGSFSVAFGDMMHPELMESMYALIEPMDLIEIRMARSPEDYMSRGIPIIMRGMVTNISRGEIMAGDKPSRTITISGHDFGKILQIFQIFFLNNSVIGDNILSEFAFFHKYAGDDSAKIRSAKEFVEEFLSGVMTPFLQKFTAFARGDDLGAKVISSWTPLVSIQGNISPYTLASFSNVQLYSLLATVLDAGAFNEMYVEDREDDIAFVVRPNPFKTLDGKYIQAGAGADSIKINSDEIIGINVGRSDANVANYYWCSNSRWALWNNEDYRMLAQTGSSDNFILFEYENSDVTRYGIRKMEVETVLGAPDYLNSEGAKAEKIPDQTVSLSQWLDDRRRILAQSNRDNVVLESGSIRMRGNERVRPGTYIEVYRGRNRQQTGEYYAPSVTHEFTPFSGFHTTATVERGTGWALRAGLKVPLYLTESNELLR